MCVHYLREWKGGALKLDKAKIALEGNLDGNCPVSTTDEHLSSEDVVLDYKQAHEIERVNRDLKHTVDLRPVYHHRGDRIMAHVLLSWWALLMIRIEENDSGESWQLLRKIVHPLSVAELLSQYGTISQTNKFNY